MTNSIRCSSSSSAHDKSLTASTTPPLSGFIDSITCRIRKEFAAYWRILPRFEFWRLSKTGTQVTNARGIHSCRL